MMAVATALKRPKKDSLSNTIMLGCDASKQVQAHAVGLVDSCPGALSPATRAAKLAVYDGGCVGP